MYIHKIRGIDKNGKYRYGFHIRLKGVPERSIKWCCSEKNLETEFADVMEIYKNLYYDGMIDFDLTKDEKGKSKLPFNFRKDFTIGMKTTFCRKVKATTGGSYCSLLLKQIKEELERRRVRRK